jgi:hypothetical protein
VRKREATAAFEAAERELARARYDYDVAQAQGSREDAEYAVRSLRAASADLARAATALRRRAG